MRPHPAFAAARVGLRRVSPLRAISSGAQSATSLILLSSLSGLSSTPRFTSLASGMMTHDGHIAYVPTAKYALNRESTRKPGDQRRRARADARKKAKELSAQFGRPTQLLELDRVSSCDEVLEALAGASCAYVDGGNTFYLRNAMRTSGFDEAIERALADSPSLLYIGQSAGAICAGDSIQTAYWKGWDDPDAAENVDWSAPSATDGLRLAPGLSVFPHYVAEEHAALIDARAAELGNSQCVPLSDNSAYVVRAGESAMFTVAGGLAPFEFSPSS